MTTIVPAGPPLEEPLFAIARRSVLIHDSERDRWLGVDCWYPALDDSGAASVYELLPGLGFTANARHETAAETRSFPLVVWSHGRTGTRSAYVMLCEGLAARGYIVVSSDHPGDTLGDWLLGAAVDDATNEAQRQADLRFVLDTATQSHAIIPAGARIDHTRIAVAGHSYGAHTVLSLCGDENFDSRIKAVAGMQSLTRSIRRSAIARISVPLLMVVGMQDATTPPELDADRAFSAAGPLARRVDIEAAGHQACSDVGLYLELAPQVPELPDFIGDFVRSMADNITGTAGDPWRPTVGLHLELLGNWLGEVLGVESTQARVEFARLVERPGVSLRLGRGMAPDTVQS